MTNEQKIENRENEIKRYQSKIDGIKNGTIVVEYYYPELQKLHGYIACCKDIISKLR